MAAAMAAAVAAATAVVAMAPSVLASNAHCWRGGRAHDGHEQLCSTMHNSFRWAFSAEVLGLFPSVSGPQQGGRSRPSSPRVLPHFAATHLHPSHLPFVHCLHQSSAKPFSPPAPTTPFPQTPKMRLRTFDANSPEACAAGEAGRKLHSSGREEFLWCAIVTSHLAPPYHPPLPPLPLQPATQPSRPLTLACKSTPRVPSI